MLRKCTSCEEEKDITRFVRQAGKYRSDIYRKDCKDCKNRKRRDKNKALGKVPYRIPKGTIAWNKGVPISLEVKEKIRASTLGRIPHNKGVREAQRRFSRKYKDWSLTVRTRDGFKCQKCGAEKKVHAHHIKPWKEDESLRFNLENGITVCRSCHAKMEGYQPGHRQTEEARKKMSIAKKGKAPWNKGLKQNGQPTTLH